MKKLSLIFFITCCILQYGIAQPATVTVPVDMGRNNCGNGGGKDSMFFLNYVSPNLSNNAAVGCQPVLKTSYPPLNGYGPSNNKPFSVFGSSIAFNPKDQMLYYVWTDYNIAAPYKSYIWRWLPNSCPVAPGGLDTVRTFNTDIGGITFDGNGVAYQLEFNATAPYTAFLRTVDFATGAFGSKDTLDLTGGKKLWDVGSGDITLTPSGQMYFVFDNKLFTPDYGSYNNPTHHIKCTYIDTIKSPSGAAGLVGLTYSNGSLLAGYAPQCVYRKIDGVTGDTGMVTYTYPNAKGVSPCDLTYIGSGIGTSKKLISATATGSPNQYDIVYEVYVKNYGNVPLTNVQVNDNLAAINGLANVSNVSASLVSNPAGVSLSGSYNGTTVTNLLTAGQILPCYPMANNNFTIRISCRLSNILSGVVYNNSAMSTANGYNNVALRDSSTNGDNPDLNQNDKPDDVGESQPTPFVIVITATTPPCATLAQTLYSQNFGSGTGLVASVNAGTVTASSAYTGVTTQPLAVNRFTVTQNATNGDNANWISLTDHTGGANGRMLLVNADAPAIVMYRDTMPVSCPGQQYSISLWASFIGNASYQTVCDGLGGFKYPKLTIRMRDLVTGLTITQYTTADITLTSWQQLGMKWVMPPGYSNVILEILNAGLGGCGNDIAIDDIVYGMCDADAMVNITGGTGCLGSSFTFTATSNPVVIPGTKDYQWQVATALAGPYFNIAGATSVNYNISSIAVSDTGKYYRVLVAGTGNMGMATCRDTSNAVKLNGKSGSVAATSANRNKNNICPGISVGLSLTGGTLGTGAVWKWYAGNCNGTSIGTGTSINVTPAVTTTYYVRAEGDCDTSICRAVTVNISCDIDKDKDGIPDWVESNMATAFADANSNGIINAYDPTFAGFVDNNNDYINDNFQADGDSDNDGIPNYLDNNFPGRIDSNGDGINDRFDTDLDGRINMLDLDSDNDGIPDVVEAYGVDTNGDGLIDNYTDSDGDGLSQNVDVNNTGASNTGQGLGIADIDGDGYPNYIDLDSDNDGIPDLIEAGGADINNNGKVDTFTDANTNGWSDVYEGMSKALLRTGVDVNNDGRADFYPFKNMDADLRPNPYDLDSDGDGIVDVIEAGLPDANLNGIVDGAIGTNGWSTTISAMFALNLRNTDTDANKDFLDIDSDDDGITDNIEGQTTAGYKIPTTTDNDGDGLANIYDQTPGFGGGGIYPVDTDGDLIPDYRDSDTDGDSQIDRVEGNDFNFNRIADDLVTLTGIDTDGDGLDDRFDNDNTSAKVTSAYMGNNGSFAGPTPPGTRSVEQMSFPSQSDRDWRYVGTVLPVQFLKFSSMPQGHIIALNWTVIAAKEIDHFEIERSIDNRNYSKAGVVKDPVALNVQQSFSFNDDINNDIIYYRIKAVDKTGAGMYSSILMIRNAELKIPISIVPNPASNYVAIQFFSEKNGEATVRLVDNIGKTVLMKKQKVIHGNNTIQLNALSRFNSGVYTIQLYIDNSVITEKLVHIK